MRPDSHEIYGRRRSRNLGLGLVAGGLRAPDLRGDRGEALEGADMQGFDHTRETLPAAAD